MVGHTDQVEQDPIPNRLTNSLLARLPTLASSVLLVNVPFYTFYLLLRQPLLRLFLRYGASLWLRSVSLPFANRRGANEKRQTLPLRSFSRECSSLPNAVYSLNRLLNFHPLGIRIYSSPF